MKKFMFLTFLFISNLIFASNVSSDSSSELLVDNFYKKCIVHDEHIHQHEDGVDTIVCQCACTLVVVIHDTAYIFSSYTNNAQTCSSMSDGQATYDTADCQDGAGMLNAQSVEEFKAAESGGGC